MMYQRSARTWNDGPESTRTQEDVPRENQDTGGWTRRVLGHGKMHQGSARTWNDGPG